MKKSSNNRYLSLFGEQQDNGLVTERFQYSTQFCLPLSVAEYRKTINSQHVTGLFSTFFQFLEWKVFSIAVVIVLQRYSFLLIQIFTRLVNCWDINI
ncbi:hypothetical protein [Capnocytophaga felis]|uniref:hypothetical protein n=1 Tax=Capnocytophaga felis TaxID=2267611 RepID=UPI00402BAF96